MLVVRCVWMSFLPCPAAFLSSVSSFWGPDKSYGAELESPLPALRAPLWPGVFICTYYLIFIYSLPGVGRYEEGGMKKGTDGEKIKEEASDAKIELLDIRHKCCFIWSVVCPA